MSTSQRPIVVVAPDSFKGSLTAIQAAAAMQAGILRAAPSAEVRVCPMADGGEGTMDALLATCGTQIIRPVRDASGVRRPVPLAILPNGEGLIEVAKIIGITDRQAMLIPVEARTSEGVGDAILALLDYGCRTIQIALGGSSTNDGGAGMLAALGLRLLDSQRLPVAPIPSELSRVFRVDATQLEARLSDCVLVAMTDVDNPLTGPEGATFIFGPQKGVAPHQLVELDEIIAKFASLCEAEMGRSVSLEEGAGAAGGLGFAVQVLGGTVRPGASMVADWVGLDRALQGAALVLTGEGKSDAQTLQGKAPALVATRGHRAGVPAILLSGSIDGTALERLNVLFAGCFSIVPGPMPLERAIGEAASLLSAQTEQVVRVFLKVS